MATKKPKIEVEYELTVEQDDTPVRGNAMVSGDDAEDRKVEDEILGRLDRGDVWAWALVKVTARIKFENRIFEGVDYLGACCYRDEADFKTPGGYFDDMKHAALESLRCGLKDAINRGNLARRLLKVLG